METSDLSAPKEPSHPSSSSNSTRTTSGAQHNRSRSGVGGECQAVSENTPINSDSTRRDYQSTEEMRNRSVASGSSQGKRRNPSQPQNERTNGVPGDGDNHQRPWYIQLANRYGSMELENKGSVARDHLALERTFLAWLRTSLAFASIGIAITQLFRLSNASNLRQRGTDSSSAMDQIQIASATERLRNLGKPLGTTFIAVAILILLVGFHRFVESQYWIVRGKFPASRGSVILIAFVAAALIIAALVVILAVAPGAVET